MSYNYEPTHEKFPNRWAWGIRMARLSEDFKVVEDRSINLNSLMAINEDMRLFIYKDRLCGVYFEGMTRGKGAGLIVVTFDEHFNIEDVFRPSFVRARNVERNWQFFGDGSDLLCAYSIQPQVILRCSPTNIVPHAKMRWRGGGYRAMCGGTPPIEFEGEYLSFFHSWFPWPERGAKNWKFRVHRLLSFSHSLIGWPMHGAGTWPHRVYSAGAYTFDMAWPFKIRRYTPRPLMAAPTHDALLDRPACVFPCGSCLHKDGLVVSYGYHDQECRLAIYRPESFREQLVPI